MYYTPKHVRVSPAMSFGSIRCLCSGVANFATGYVCQMETVERCGIWYLSGINIGMNRLRTRNAGSTPVFNQ